VSRRLITEARAGSSHLPSPVASLGPGQDCCNCQSLQVQTERSAGAFDGNGGSSGAWSSILRRPPSSADER
jgi:hypothetical protein